MPIHTRSTTKRLTEIGNGIYAFTSLSETGEGIHTRFEYGDCQSSKALGVNSSFSSNHSATPTLTSSLSSISSGSSSNQSINSMFDDSLSSISDSSSSLPSSSKWDSYHNLQLFGPRTNHIDATSSCTLQRTSAQRWFRDSETGELHMMSEDNSWPTSSSQSEQAHDDEDGIFEREYRKVIENGEHLADLTRKLVVLEELNEDMTFDTRHMFSIANRARPGVEEACQVTSGSNERRLGPEGTELIDETFRAPSGELGVYPEKWVIHQSTLLQSQPTEPNIL